MKKLSALALGSVLSLTGCAAIVGDESQTVFVDSSPSQALFVISDNNGRVAATGTTPTTVTLPKSDGTYLGWLSYQITFSKADFQPVIMPLKTRPNAWYIFGNLSTLGAGWLIDPFWGGHVYPASRLGAYQYAAVSDWQIWFILFLILLK
ncbi:hypothetical protein [Obesumbacterium proteus]|uniref:Lipoprotein n=1 Tax=Obesumbacterium proteus ATCC 12841 TaxID=1354268 RepID=A0AA91EHH4_9GAMM|nr:hypothetical protein [Obesumbacterium proteus]OAT60869.1 hypothetical protein M993_00343 [Obesumbacterium proteus ATCC 12841]